MLCTQSHVPLHMSLFFPPGLPPSALVLSFFIFLFFIFNNIYIFFHPHKTALSLCTSDECCHETAPTTQCCCTTPKLCCSIFWLTFTLITTEIVTLRSRKGRWWFILPVTLLVVTGLFPVIRLHSWHVTSSWDVPYVVWILFLSTIYGPLP